MIVRNRIKCLLCKTIIESKHTHDFKWCKCKSVAVDGGKSYLKRCGNESDYVDMSVIKGDDNG